jgi:uncharacterized protein (TIGR03086 family)
MRRYTLLLNQATGDGGVEASESRDLGPNDWIGAFNSEHRAMREAFQASGAFERTVAHPGMSEIAATNLIDMGMGELAVHGWDLARAIGADQTIDPQVVAVVRAFFEPLHGIQASTGYFSSTSGDVPDSAPQQTRLLDLLGRRP